MSGQLKSEENTMTNALVHSARVVEARARISAFAERLVLENLVADYRRGRDPTDNINQLLKLQDLKRRMGIQQNESD
ncbi:MAG: hypothetical protein Q7R90_01555 [bacterium]|nr:hypothetical protein [bacterium]